MRPLLVTALIITAAVLFFSCEPPFDDVSWTEVTVFYNGWTSRTGFEPVSYCKDAQGFVHIRGVAEDTDALSANSSIFHLPEGCRPAYNTAFSVVVFSGGTEAATLWVYASGTVTVYYSANVTYTYFGEIIFYAG
ncbi:MAG TPA: hypothetical protein ENN69_05655 [Spirochaetia bacterium]|nr:hypothetical protein [Spirochaetia bacterium]